jgi:siderophore synthetase component
MITKDACVQDTFVDRSYRLAEHITIERLLNIFLRESELSALPLTEELLSRVSTHFSVIFPPGGYEWFVLPLKRHGGKLVGHQSYHSPQGYHRYGERFWLLTADQQVQWIGQWAILAQLLLDEMNTDDMQKHKLLRDIANSLEKMTYYAQHHDIRSPLSFAGSGVEQFLAAEQALVFGHPFHPTPKSLDGFTLSDMQRYAPELGTNFILHYFALAPELIAEDWLSSEYADVVIPASVMIEASKRLSEQHRQYRLLPCHPWQAGFLLQSRTIQELQQEKRLIYLGPLGAAVYALSSVRTICDPAHRYMFKLPLHVRVTNFLRINSNVQVARSLDASRLIQALQSDWPYEKLSIMKEHGYRGIGAGSVLPDDFQWLFENLTVLFRENLLATSDKAPLVVAGLLEGSARGDAPALIQMLQSASGSERPSASLVTVWLQRYLQYVLLPIVELFVEYGLSLEAHVQNMLIYLEDGWPTGCAIRDMEGVSMSRDHAWCKHLIDEQSPVLHSDGDAWHRLKYYCLTNHMAHLIHVLAYYGEGDERTLWKVVRAGLEESRLYRTARGRRYLNDLFSMPTLPAKANLLSCLSGRSETPLYVPVANLLADMEVAR